MLFRYISNKQKRLIPQSDLSPPADTRDLENGSNVSLLGDLTHDVLEPLVRFFYWRQLSVLVSLLHGMSNSIRLLSPPRHENSRTPANVSDICCCTRRGSITPAHART